jgi:hypothetical protein
VAGADAAARPATSKHALFERVLARDAPEALRLGAARGALPVPAQDRVLLQIRLLADPLPAVVAAAREGLAATATEALAPLPGDPDCEPDVLDYCARSGRFQGEALAQVIAHPRVGDATLESLAASGDADVLGLLLTNEVRVIQNPSILRLLAANPKLTTNQRRRLLELERDFVGKDLPARAASAKTGAGPHPVAEVIPFPEAPIPGGGSAAGEVPQEAAGEAGEGAEPGTAADGEAPPPEFDEEALQRTDAYQRIQRLNVAERNILAMKGNSEERAILIRDTARIVCQAVLKNPRLSETEVVNYAGMRSVHEDILRSISQNREWTKSYAVAWALVRNPKTPAGVSVQFLGRLGTRDLKIAAGDKNVPELIRRQARVLFLARTQPAKKTFKKAH